MAPKPKRKASTSVQKFSYAMAAMEQKPRIKVAEGLPDSEADRDGLWNEAVNDEALAV